MALNLYMVGVTTQNMSKSVEFYRRLGLTIPDGEEGKPHIEVKMPGELTFFLNDRPIASDNPELIGTPAGSYSMLLEFYLKTEAAVEAKYEELIAQGYTSYHTPLKTNIGMLFAFVNDPDGNTILLSGDLETDDAASNV
ncbi:MAG TPA: VOC family protein [Ktedonobacterales bacterium]